MCVCVCVCVCVCGAQSRGLSCSKQKAAGAKPADQASGARRGADARVTAARQRALDDAFAFKSSHERAQVAARREC